MPIYSLLWSVLCNLSHVEESPESDLTGSTRPCPIFVIGKFLLLISRAEFLFWSLGGELLALLIPDGVPVMTSLSTAFGVNSPSSDLLQILWIGSFAAVRSGLLDTLLSEPLPSLNWGLKSHNIIVPSVPVLMNIMASVSFSSDPVFRSATLLVCHALIAVTHFHMASSTRLSVESYGIFCGGMHGVTLSNGEFNVGLNAFPTRSERSSDLGRKWIFWGISSCETEEWGTGKHIIFKNYIPIR